MSQQGKALVSHFAGNVICRANSARSVGLIALVALISSTAAFAQNAASQPSGGGGLMGEDSTPKITTGARPAGAGGGLIVGGISDDGTLKLSVNKSQIVTLARRPGSINIGDPAVADVSGISPTRMLVTAKKAGTTQIIFFDEQGGSQSVDVVVQAELGGLRQQLDRLFPNNKIEAVLSGDTIILSGHVSNLQQADQAAQLSQSFAQKVVNLIEVTGGQQVMLQVRVAEVSKTATSQLGVNLGWTDGRAFVGSNIGQVAPFGSVIHGASANATGVIGLTAPDAASLSTVTLFGNAISGDSSFNYFLAALRENNLLRVLAEPNLVTMSGQEAQFLAGGEFPIPVPQSSSGNSTTITIEFKEFGVRLKFTPVVLGDGRIRLKLAPEVSDLDFSTAIRFNGFVVPGLTTRRASATVEISDGQSLALAGLLNQNTNASKQVTPLLGDIPILGALFRSVRYQRRESELVILVTPRIVAPMQPSQVAPLPGEYWRHPDEGAVFWMQDLGGQAPADRKKSTGAGTVGNAPRRPAPLFQGDYGFGQAPGTTQPQTSPGQPR
jgi:pilus assembly protein CpaC